MNSKPEYAGFWTRCTAYTLDSIILGIPFVLFITPLVGMFLFDPEAVKAQMAANNPANFFALYQVMIETVVVLSLLWAAVLAWVTSTKWQATVGKRIMGVYVVGADGSRPKFLQLFWRYAALPLVVLTIQTPERYFIYEALQKIAETGVKDMDEVAKSLVTPISGLVGWATLVLVCGWYALVGLRPQKTAGHDILFNTRVIYGRP